MFDVLPEVAVTIAGFAGLIVILRRSNAGFSPLDQFALYFLLLTSLGAALLGLLPSVINLYVAPNVAPTILCAISGVFLLVLAVWRSIHIYKFRAYPRSIWLRRTLGFLQWLLVVALFLAVAGVLPPDALFATSLWWLVFVAVVQFFIQVVATVRASDDA